VPVDDQPLAVRTRWNELVPKIVGFITEYNRTAKLFRWTCDRPRLTAA
jgi:hypothetical protein